MSRSIAFFCRTIFSHRALAYTSGGTIIGVGSRYWYLNYGPIYPTSTLKTCQPPLPWTPPTRSEMLSSLCQSDVKGRGDEGAEQEFDLLIVGGGAMGAGVAVDAISHGLKAALVERDDCSAGTLSKSTKLVHGDGVTESKSDSDSEFSSDGGWAINIAEEEMPNLSDVSVSGDVIGSD